MKTLFGMGCLVFLLALWLHSKLSGVVSEQLLITSKLEQLRAKPTPPQTSYWPWLMALASGGDSNLC